MNGMMKDVEYGLRTLLRNPGFAAVAILSLALGISSNTVIFTLSNAMLFRPLSVENPDRLVSIFTGSKDDNRYNHTSFPDYRDLRDRSEVFSGLAGHFYYPMNLVTPAGPAVVTGQTVSWNYFDVLGVKPFQGRFFVREEEAAPGGVPVTVVSYRSWVERFGSDLEILGKKLLINNYPFTVVGIAPKGFNGVCVFLGADVWVPITMAGQVAMFPVDFNQRSQTMVKLVARLKPGVRLAEAQAATDALAAGLASEYPRTNERKIFPMVELDRNRAGWLDTTDMQKRLMGFLMAIVSLVLFIACFNVANLLLARAAARQREVAVRLSLGASPRRILRQLLTESLLLSVLACGAGLLLSVWAVEAIRALAPRILEFPVEMDFGLDRRVLLFSVAVSLAAAVIFGLAPALHAARADLAAAASSQGRSATQAKGKARLQCGFVVAQLALSLILLAVTGLCVRSLRNTLAVDPGFDVRRGLVAPINLGYVNYDEARGRSFHRTLLERVARIPGVESAALAADVPLGQLHIRNRVSIEGYQPPRGQSLLLRFNLVSPRYFETLRIPLLAGRGIEERDVKSSKRVVVINETMARRYWPGQEPLGRTIHSGGGAWEVVGVMKDGKYDDLDEAPQPYYCIALQQVEYLKRLTLHVRTTADPEAMMAPVSREIRRIEPNMPLANMLTMTQFLDTAVEQTAGPARVVGIFGLLALVLATVGVYGVTAYTVSQRTQELAIRVAFGASRWEITRLILNQGLRIALVGTAVGVLLSLGVARVLARFLYGVSAVDLPTFGAVSLILVAVALAACYLPARHAARVEPAGALRYE